MESFEEPEDFSRRSGRWGSIDIVSGFGGLNIETSMFSENFISAVHVETVWIVVGRVRVAVSRYVMAPLSKSRLLIPPLLGNSITKPTSNPPAPNRPSPTITCSSSKRTTPRPLCLPSIVVPRLLHPLIILLSRYVTSLTTSSPHLWPLRSWGYTITLPPNVSVRCVIRVARDVVRMIDPVMCSPGLYRRCG